jgi:muramoyltetrapeptide carboxypeptidase LdcA involved in peptidoglycan recycling
MMITKQSNTIRAISLTVGNLDAANKYLKAVSQLQEMGYTYLQVKSALQSSNFNLDAAAAKLVDGI